MAEEEKKILNDLLKKCSAIQYELYELYRKLSDNSIEQNTLSAFDKTNPSLYLTPLQMRMKQQMREAKLLLRKWVDEASEYVSDLDEETMQFLDSIED